MNELAILDGFDAPAARSGDNIIQGALIKFADGSYTADDEPLKDRKLLAIDTLTAAQHWSGQKPVDTLVQKPGGTPIDIDELNAKIPESKWEIGLAGEPRPPWQMQHIVYFLNPADGSMFTMANGTAGQRIAVQRLRQKVACMRALRGARVVPLVEFTSATMKTAYGKKQRPEFNVLDWHTLGTPGTAQKQVTGPVEPITTAELVDDAIDF